ncbi:MAG: spore coat protein CotJB [Lachnospiraceae bacterium]|nr:spore coat protein CotJB [Lachnospiraceae bacterium]
MRYNKKELLNYIDVVSFAVVEANLYLDTHPNDEAAIEYFNNYQRARNQALREYANAFGPLNLDTAVINREFIWANQSWPWQLEG